LPTGSFKDRGAAVLSAHLKRLGAERIIVDSSGNAAAAMAGYAAANGMQCVVYAPATTSPGKLVQARAFGATVHLIEGNREAVASAAQEAAERDAGAYYASHNWHPVFVEGVKTWAIEVREQLGYRTPDSAFVPTGGGSAFVGAYVGFCDQMPALVACQPAACAPIHDAWKSGHSATDVLESRSGRILPVTPGTTIAEGTRIGAPAREVMLLNSIAYSGGWAEAVDEDEIVTALRELWGQGLYVEPTAAVGAAGFIRASRSGLVERDADNVVLLTGSGLKATDAIASLLA
jgi:threonine synthase